MPKLELYAEYNHTERTAKRDAPKDGSLLVAQYGKGYFVYTGSSFFRQLPAGVSGAYKLFANLISLGKGESASALNGKENQKGQK